MCGADKKCQAERWHSFLYLSIGIIAIALYLGLSIGFYAECHALHDTSLYPIHCGSNAMWACMGWVPLFFFIVIIALAFHYFYKQATSANTAIDSSRAWLIAFVCIACCVLFFIHICYIGYIGAELLVNPGCDAGNELADLVDQDGKRTYVDCGTLHELVSALLFFAIVLMLFVCSSMALLFALANESIANPVNYETVRNLKNEPSDVEEGVENGDTAETQPMRAAYDSDDDDGSATDAVQASRSKKRQQQQRITNLAEHKLGARVIVALSYDNNEGCYATVRWYGPVKATEYPTEWTTASPFLYGVVLDERKGNSNGGLAGRSVFECDDGFGLFVPPSHIKALSPEQYPLRGAAQTQAQMTKTTKAPTVRVPQTATATPNGSHAAVMVTSQQYVQTRGGSFEHALVITRGSEANHLFNGKLFAFLRKLVLQGRVRCAPIGRVDKRSHTKRLRTEAMLRVVFPDNNHTLSHYLSLLSTRTAYAKVFSPQCPASLLEELKHDSEHAHGKEEEDEEEEEEKHASGVPAVNMWYLQLHETWNKHSGKIKALAVADYESSQWKTQCDKRAIEWYALLLEMTHADAVKQVKTRFDRAPLPLFVRYAQQQQQRSGGGGAHMVPLGVFHDKPDIEPALRNEVEWLEPPPVPHILERIDEAIEFRLKRLIHEPLCDVDQVLPYLYCESFRKEMKHASLPQHAWFPLEFVYAEIEISDASLEHRFNEAHRSYRGPFETVDFSTDPDSFNPYYLMKCPRVPLFTVSVCLPLARLQRYAMRHFGGSVAAAVGGGGASMLAAPNPPPPQPLKQSPKESTSQQRNRQHPNVNTSVSIDNDKYDRHGDVKNHNQHGLSHSQTQKRVDGVQNESIRDRKTQSKQHDRHSKHHKHKKRQPVPPGAAREGHSYDIQRKPESHPHPPPHHHRHNHRSRGQHVQYQSVKRHDEDDEEEPEEEEEEAYQSVQPQAPNGHHHHREEDASTESEDEDESSTSGESETDPQLQHGLVQVEDDDDDETDGDSEEDDSSTESNVEANQLQPVTYKYAKRNSHNVNSSPNVKPSKYQSHKH